MRKTVVQSGGYILTKYLLSHGIYLQFSVIRHWKLEVT